MYMTDHSQPDLGQLKGWTWSFDCDTHENMHWRFDGKYLINELGTYLGRLKMGEQQFPLYGSPSYWTHLNLPKKGKLSNVDFNDDRLFWEYDPVTKLLGYPYSTPIYLTRRCIDKPDEPASRDCNWRLIAKPKLTDNAITTANEEVEQRFSLDYQGCFVSLT